MAEYYGELNINYYGGRTKRKSKKQRQSQAITRGIKLASFSSKTTSSVITRVGQYTGNKISQRNISTLVKYSGFAVTAIGSPYVALASVAVDTANNLTDFVIRNVNSEQQNDYKRSLLGNMATSNSRWRGNYK